MYPIARLSWLHGQIINSLLQINTNRCWEILAFDAENATRWCKITESFGLTLSDELIALDHP